MQSPLFTLINLGCPKNTVDSERILAHLAQSGFLFTADESAADLILVNTCGFIADAREEAARTLEETRAANPEALLIATGCLVERTGGDPALANYLAHADARIGFADYPRLPEICLALLTTARRTAPAAKGYRRRPLPSPYFHWLNGPRMLIGGGATALLKLGEGCSNRCAYCSIPLIRGDRVSRPLGDLLAEAAELDAAGIRELTLIAQDTTAYGLDTGGTPLLPKLLRALPKAAPHIPWFRILYAHPRHLTDSILRAMAASPRILPYLDLPLQHITDPMLHRMQRHVTRKEIEQRLTAIERHLPGASLRTTFLVGHPGETDADFAELLAFVKQGRFETIGAFAYSPEPGTPSARMKPAIPPETAQERVRLIYAAQRAIWRQRATARIGTKTPVMLDSPTRGGWLAHAPFQMPGEDGAIRLRLPPGSKRRPAPGQIITARITAARFPDYTATPAR